MRVFFDKIHDKDSDIKVRAERTFLLAINGGCHVPVGANARIINKNLIVKEIYGKNNANIVIHEVFGDVKNPEQLGIELAKKY